MNPRSHDTLRMLLHAAARVLGCNSAQMALIDGEALVLRLGVSNTEATLLRNVELELGFAAEGASLPLSTEGSVLVRTVREGRLLVTANVSHVIGRAVPDEVSARIQELIGPQTFATVPVLGRSGPVGVILFSKAGESGFAPADRDLLVAYADRVGAALESEGVSEGGEALGGRELGDVGLPPPVVHLCDGTLRVVDAAGAAAPLLWDVLRAPGQRAALLEAAARPGNGARILPLATDDGRSLRVTLAPQPGQRFVVVVEDVGWLERLAREAARAREHLARLLGAVPDGVFTLDEQGVIVGCNAAAQKLVGQPPAALLGAPLEALLGDDRSRRRAAELRRRLHAAGHAEGELRLSRGARGVDVAVAALLLADDEGRPAGALWRARDLSERRRGDAERKRLRERLLRSERLSSLGEMAARIAHEVRNPLVSIGAAARVIEEELESSEARAPVRDEVQAIQREVRRLDGIVSGFLHFAGGHGPLRPPREEVDLEPLVAETLALVRARAPGVELRLTADGPCRARCDPGGLRQVLWNVLTNAIEASPDGGVVTCTVRAAGDQVELSIADEGPGIASNVRRRAFDPFYSTKARGTGLGLAITRQIVDEHGGRIRLLARRAGGTIVRIELPAV